MDLFLFVTSTAVSLYFNHDQKKKQSSSLLSSSSEKKTQVVTLGLLCLDIHAASVDALPAGGSVQFIDKIHLSCAGTSGGTAIILAKLGLSTSIVGCIGKSDELGRYLLTKLTSLNISTKSIQYSTTKSTSATVINVRSNGDRPCLHQLGASDDLDLSSSTLIQQVITSNPDVIHVGGLGLFPDCTQQKTLLFFLQALATKRHSYDKPIMVIAVTILIGHIFILLFKWYCFICMMIGFRSNRAACWYIGCIATYFAFYRLLHAIFRGE